MAKKNRKKKVAVAVVTVPFPMQGHLTPLLRLSRRIAASKVPVHYVGSATTIHQAAARSDEDWNSPEIEYFHSLHFPTPPFQNLSPNSNSRFPTHLFPMIAATLSGFREPLFSLVNYLTSNYTRVVVIFDALMASTVKSVHSLPNVESYVLETSSPFTIYSAYWEKFGKPRILPEAAKIMREIPSMEGCFSPEFEEFVYKQYDVRDFHSGTIFNSCRLIEGLYLDSLANLPQFGEKIWAVGPLNPVHENEMSVGVANTKGLNWVLNQPRNSHVLLVSFGMATSLSNEQIEELALGLERSGVKFLWLLREADRGDIFGEGGGRGIELPLGFEERVRDRGMVVREWESQFEILDGIDGFLTNCGWNSCMESITKGVPIAAWPMHSDQPRNAVLMTKVLKIGVEVIDWEYRDELVYSSKIERVIRKLMGSAEGDAMRKRARKLAELVDRSWSQGTAGRLEMGSFIKHIARKD